MSSTNLRLPDNFADAEVFQRLFVKPMVDGVKSQIETMLKPIVEGHSGIKAHLDQQDMQINKLVRDQKKALLGWSVYATAAAATLAWGWNWVKSKVRVG